MIKVQFLCYSLVIVMMPSLLLQEPSSPGPAQRGHEGPEGGPELGPGEHLQAGGGAGGLLQQDEECGGDPGEVEDWLEV